MYAEATDASGETAAVSTPRDRNKYDISVRAAGSATRTSCVLEPLERGSKLFLDPTGRRHVVTSVPDVFTDIKVRFTVSFAADAPCANADYLKCKLQDSVYLLVLLPSLMLPPTWLKDRFSLVNDTHVGVKWELQTTQRFLLTMHQRLEPFNRQTLQVWQSKTAIRRNTEITLGGAEGRNLSTDMNYVLATCSQPLTENHHGRKARRRQSQYYTAVGEALTHQDQSGLQALLGFRGNSGGAPPDTEAMLQLGMAKGDLELLRLMLEKGMAEDVSEDTAQALMEFAMGIKDLGLLCLVVQKSGAEFTPRALRVLLSSWESLSSFGVDLEQLLGTYVLERRNCMSSASAILHELKLTAARQERVHATLKSLINKFQVLVLLLVRQLPVLLPAAGGHHSHHHHHRQTAKVRGSVRFTATGEPVTLEKVLEPSAEGTPTINDNSPLRTAYEIHDERFISNPVLVRYTQQRWLGRRYFALLNGYSPLELKIGNPNLGYVLLRNLGFTGSFADPLISATCRLWHVSIFSSRAFFNSARGRWALRMLSEVLFMPLFQLTAIWNSTQQLPMWIQAALTAYILGHWADFARESSRTHTRDEKLGGTASKQMKYIHLTCIGGNLVWLALNYLRDNVSADRDGMQLLAEVQRAVIAVLSVLIWVRLLSLIVPLWKRLGALLSIVRQMTQELIKVGVPVIFVMTGFATAFQTVYNGNWNLYNTFYTSMLSCLATMLGQFDVTTFPDVSVTIDVSGRMIFIFFCLAFNILIMNFLTGMVQRFYRPEKVEAESIYNQSEMMDSFVFGQRKGWVCSPFVIFQVALFWLPERERVRVSPNTFARLLLPPLDGLPPPPAPMQPQLNPGSMDGSVSANGGVTVDSSTGASVGYVTIKWGYYEIQNLVFLIGMFPIMAAITLLGYVLFTPFACYNFATGGYNRLLLRKRTVRPGQATRQNKPLAQGGVGGLWNTDGSRRSRSFSAGSEPDSSLLSGFGARVSSVCVFLVAFLAGFVLYLPLLGGLGLCLWSFTYVYSAKLLWALANIVLAPFEPVWLKLRSCIGGGGGNGGSSTAAAHEDGQGKAGGRGGTQSKWARAVKLATAAPEHVSPRKKPKPSANFVTDLELQRLMKRAHFKIQVRGSRATSLASFADEPKEESSSSSESGGSDVEDALRALQKAVRAIQAQSKAIVSWQKQIDKRLLGGGRRAMGCTDGGGGWPGLGAEASLPETPKMPVARLSMRNMIAR